MDNSRIYQKENFINKPLKIVGNVLKSFYTLPTMARKYLDVSNSNYFSVVDEGTIFSRVLVGSILGTAFSFGLDYAFNLGRYGEYSPSKLEFLTCLSLGTVTNVASGLYELGRKSKREREDLRARNDLDHTYANNLELTEEELSRIGTLQLDENPSLEDIAYKFEIPKEKE